MDQESNGSSQKNVIIIGGSICGLMHGIVCRSHGHSVQVLEREPASSLSPRGAGIVLGDSIGAFFGLLGAAFSPPSIRNSRRIFLDRLGEPVGRVERGQDTTSWELLYHRLRDLFGGLPGELAGDPLAAASPGRPAARHRVGCEAVSVRPRADGAKIEVGLVNADGAVEVAVADLVIAADGFNSTARRLLLPGVAPEYAGYVALRGTVPERDLSDAAAAVCVGGLVFHNAPGLQAVAYTIPGPHGLLEPGGRLVNWVWYQNCPAGSDEEQEMMTDIDGTVHRTTVPPGKLSPAVWSRQLRRASSQLPPQFTDIIEKTAEPFVQKITDVAVSRCAFQDGRVLLVGDAAFGLRPHTGSSTDQAAFQALRLSELLRGTMGVHQWEDAVVKYGLELHRAGVDIGRECGLGT